MVENRGAVNFSNQPEWVVADVAVTDDGSQRTPTRDSAGFTINGDVVMGDNDAFHREFGTMQHRNALPISRPAGAQN